MANWQVDIPGLSQLVLGVGAHGLKQLALSGVDIHTIGCLLMLSELVPASQSFRTNLNARREKQRGQRQWLYKFVEIGAGSSFLADHLLKTRAGENVLALMAAIVPLMAPDACINVVSLLFENAGAPLDHTPGIGQILKVRNALVPFVRHVGFQEKVLQYNEHFKRIAVEGTINPADKPGADPYDAIPSEPTLPHIVQICSKLATAEKSTLLYFRGFPGAAWVAAYASIVLGLPVCAVDRKGLEIPLNQIYGKSKIIFELGAKESSFEFFTEGKLGDAIRIETLKDESRRSWSVDCLELNFFNHNFPETLDSADVAHISDITAILTLECVARYVDLLYQYSDLSSQVPGYWWETMPQIQSRSLEILSTLGFHSRKRVKYEYTQSFSVSWACIASYMGHAFADQLTSWAPLSSQFTHTIGQRILETTSLLTLLVEIRPDTERLPWIEHFLGKSGTRCLEDACYVIATAAEVSSLLAFSNWRTGLHALSVKAFPVVGSPFGRCESIQTVARTAAISHSITGTKGMISTLFQGPMLFEDQQKEVLSQAFINPTYPPLELDPDNNTGPWTLVSDMQSRILFSGLGETLRVRHEIFANGSFLTCADPLWIAERVYALEIAKPCGHASDADFDPKPIPLPNGAGLVTLCSGFHTLILDAANLETNPGDTKRVYYQQVRDNDLAQWLSCQADYGHPNR
ncbi:MAG: hypothetical protein Q9174_005006, partial [Haloplaca sp. 1 TL-2023]